MFDLVNVDLGGSAPDNGGGRNRERNPHRRYTPPPSSTNEYKLAMQMNKALNVMDFNVDTFALTLAVNAPPAVIRRLFDMAAAVAKTLVFDLENDMTRTPEDEAVAIIAQRYLEAMEVYGV